MTDPSAPQDLDTLGRTAAEIAAGFDASTVTILDCATRLLGHESSAAGRSDAAAILRAGHRALLLANHLRAFGRDTPPALTRVDLRLFLERLCTALARLAPETTDICAPEVEAGASAVFDPIDMELALSNLVLHAQDAFGGGRITASLAWNACADGDPRRVLLRLCCSGAAHAASAPGETMALPTTLGLSLATAYPIIRRSGGTLDVTCRADAIDFTVSFRASRDGSAPERRLVLVVDDEAPVRRLVGRVLANAGYEIVDAPSLAHARAIIDQHEGRLRLAIVDVALGAENGADLAREILRRHPDVPVTLMTGHGEAADIPVGLRMLSKPFGPAALLETVHAACRTDISQH